MLKLTENENVIFNSLKEEAAKAVRIHNAGNAPSLLVMLQIIARLQNKIEFLEKKINVE